MIPFSCSEWPWLLATSVRTLFKNPLNLSRVTSLGISIIHVYFVHRFNQLHVKSNIVLSTHFLRDSFIQ